MAPLKRKRPHDGSGTESHALAPAPARRATRQNPLRAPATDPASEAKHQLRSGRVRAKVNGKALTTEVSPVETREAENDASKSTAAPAPVSAAAPALTRQTKTRTTRHSAGTETTSVAATASDQEAKRQTRTPTPPRKAGKALRSPKQHVLRNDHSPPLTAPRVQKRGEKRPESPPNTRIPPPKHSRPAPAPKTAASSSTALASTPKRQTTSNKRPKPPPTPHSDRNIDKVALGDICFRAWYPSYYGKEVLGGGSDVSGNNSSSSNTAGTTTTSNGAATAAAAATAGGKNGGGKHRDPPVLDRLYVCPCCFKYSKELVLWWEHVRCCETKAEVPGRRIYTHPRGSRKGTRGYRVSGSGSGTGESGAGKGRGKRKADGATGKTAEETVSDEGEWSIWEVDGEKDVLFCQNLSLFAKLFLDNKSVFFDVTGFNYFLLVYTPSAASATQTSPSLTNNTHARPSSSGLGGPATAHTLINSDPSSQTQGSPPQQHQHQHQPQPSPSTSISSSSSRLPPAARPQIVGFFSKEKMSWDNNNLACILVFPPWQRKGLGALLMGVSYEISRREGILGGPEKPISELGRKGYKRYWAGEIARWLLGLEATTASATGTGTVTQESGGGAGNDGNRGSGTEGEKIKDKSNAEGEILVNVEQCSRATWIVQEDCLAVLREMGVVQEAGVGPARGTDGDGDGVPGATATAAANTIGATAAIAAIASALPSMDMDMNGDERSDDRNGGGKGGVEVGVGLAISQGGATGKEKDREDRQTGLLVPRVRVDKEAVRRWVHDNGIELSRTCDPAGFTAEGYAVKSGKGERDRDDGGGGGVGEEEDGR